MIWDEFLRHFRFCDEEDSGLSDEEQKRKGPKNRPKHTRKRIHQAKKNFLKKFKTASYSQSEMDCEKWNGTQRRRNTKFIFLREQSTQRVALSSVLFAFSLNYSSASLCLCVRFFRKPILFYYKQALK
ncbi:hypothetical protein QUW14_06025 [Bacteroides gallinaceum]|uniref:hypothetical protein n=1 Tax=Bacteroides gallinaceum TaxID=1462571 RepID=UPI0025A41CF0|nr:hypothetical protein [Bacteroides gallinaceum]MDM8153877.1 hypothetical protein [Bacteroides gallinaceum]